MSKEAPAELKPPYVTYATFNTLIKGFREGVLPSRIDRSVMPGTANGVQTYLLSALRFFGLTDDKGTPTSDFKILVDADLDDERRKTEWKRIVERSYDFIFNGGLDLQRATESQLDEKFREKGLDGATLRKCHTFFTKAVEAAGIALGPHAKSSTKSSGGSGTPRGPRRKKKVEGGAAGNGGVTGGGGGGRENETVAKSMREMLLAKFPPFNPEWPVDIQTKWFAGFEKLMASAEKGGAI